LSVFIRYRLRAGKGVSVLDPHGDLIEDMLLCIPDNRLDDVICSIPPTSSIRSD